jgi:NitT/TauT family transport system permease protein
VSVRRYATPALTFLALFVVWQALSWSGVWPRVLLPSPLDVASYVVRGFADGTLAKAMLVTMWRLLVGYAIGLVIGLPLGLAVARWRVLEGIGVLALGLQTLPSVCWVPLALLWFGQTEAAMQFVVVMGTLWAILLATQTGIRHVPPLYARAARTMGASPAQTLVLVILPAALPHVVSGMKQGWAFAWRSLMAAEIFVTILTGMGLGHLLHYGRELHAMDQVFGVMLVIVAVGLLADRVLFSPWERFMHRRWGTGAAAGP